MLICAQCEELDTENQKLGVVPYSVTQGFFYSVTQALACECAGAHMMCDALGMGRRAPDLQSFDLLVYCTWDGRSRVGRQGYDGRGVEMSRVVPVLGLRMGLALDLLPPNLSKRVAPGA